MFGGGNIRAFTAKLFYFTREIIVKLVTKLKFECFLNLV